MSAEELEKKRKLSHLQDSLLQLLRASRCGRSQSKGHNQLVTDLNLVLV